MIAIYICNIHLYLYILLVLSHHIIWYSHDFPEMPPMILQCYIYILDKVQYPNISLVLFGVIPQYIPVISYGKSQPLLIVIYPTLLVWFYPSQPHSFPWFYPMIRWQKNVGNIALGQYQVVGIRWPWPFSVCKAAPFWASPGLWRSCSAPDSWVSGWVLVEKSMVMGELGVMINNCILMG